LSGGDASASRSSGGKKSFGSSLFRGGGGGKQKHSAAESNGVNVESPPGHEITGRDGDEDGAEPPSPNSGAVLTNADGSVTSLEDPLKESDFPDPSTIRARAVKHHRALVIGLLKGRVVWRPYDGVCGMWRDLWFFLCQEHPLLCVLLAHPAHPFKKSERLMHLVAMLLLAFFIAAIGQLNYAELPLFSQEKITWMFVSNVIVVAADLLMREMATCTCIQPGGACESCGKCCGCAKDCAEAGVFWLRVCCGFSFCLAVIGFSVLAASGESNEDGSVDYTAFIVLFVITKLIVWASTTLLDLALFFYYRSAQKPNWDGGKRSSTYPYGPALPSSDYLFFSQPVLPCYDLFKACYVAACAHEVDQMKREEEYSVDGVLSKLERFGYAKKLTDGSEKGSSGGAAAAKEANWSGYGDQAGKGGGAEDLESGGGGGGEVAAVRRNMQVPPSSPTSASQAPKPASSKGSMFTSSAGKKSGQGGGGGGSGANRGQGSSAKSLAERLHKKTEAKKLGQYKATEADPKAKKDAKSWF